MHRAAIVFLLSAFLFGASTSASADSVLYVGSGEGAEDVDLSASALFTIEGSTLTIRLTNTGDSSGLGADIPSNSLTGVFFDLPGSITLSPLSATVTAGAILQPEMCDPGMCDGSTTNVGGEFAYNTNNGGWSGHEGNHAISSAGYINLNTGNMGGTDLDAPPAPDGMNFGIVAEVTAANAFNPNGGLEGVPLIEEEVIFTFTITKNGQLYEDLLLSQISNVSFQYGTSLTQPRLPGGMRAPSSIPEPAAILLIAPALALALRRRRVLRNR